MIELSPSQILTIIGLILVIAELFIGIEAGFDLVLIGSILILSGLLGVASNVTIALIIAILLAIAYVFFGRKIIRKKLILTTKKTNIDKLIGKRAIVIRTITPDTPGMVRLDDEDWRATSDQTLFEKDKVEVKSIEGVTLKVSAKGRSSYGRKKSNKSKRK